MATHDDDVKDKRVVFGLYFTNPQANIKLDALKQRLGLPKGRIVELLLLQAPDDLDLRVVPADGKSP